MEKFNNLAKKVKCCKANFIRLALERGVIGHPSPSKIEEVGMTASLEDFFSLNYYIKGKKRDVEMRLYWDDGVRNGGCISIPK